MIRMNVNFEEPTYIFLMEHNDLSFSEHVRRAVTEYVRKLKKLNVSASNSKRGDNHG